MRFVWWSIVSALVAALLLTAGLDLRRDETLQFFEQAAPDILIGMGAALLGFVGLVLLANRLRGAGVSADGPEESGPARSRPYVSLFLISFVALFVELALIRYCGSQLRIFSFYKNVPLISCFLGLGLGCLLARGAARNALTFLQWLVPVIACLSAGSLALSQALGKHAAIGTSEHVLGDFVPTEDDLRRRLASQLLIAAFSLATLVAITLLMAQLGRLMGTSFERVGRLRGYTVNIVGSLAGILGFLLVSWLQTPPWLWFAVGLLPLLWWLPDRTTALWGVGLAAACVVAAVPSYGNTVWSPYQKLVGHDVRVVPREIPETEAYLVEISDVFYQLAVDLRPEAVAAIGVNPFPHYSAVYQRLPRPGSVLIVGAGTGNDVAAALRAGAERVDAVDIDPAIVAMGEEHHPERPYSDPRVRVLVDDARHAFRTLPAASYDIVVFGLLDSHAQLGISSVRLDNYVFTEESLREARRLVRPGGHIVVTAATFHEWFRERIEGLVAQAVDSPVGIAQHGLWYSYVGTVRDARPAPPRTSTLTLPTDDWPFLYLPRRGIPAGYLLVVGVLALGSVFVLWRAGLPLASISSYHGHLFFLGAAFLLMEVHAIDRLALLFGTTWIVSGATIALVLLLIVAANLTVLAVGEVPYWIAYGALAASLAVSFWLQPAAVLGRGAPAILAFGLALLSPVYFAGLVFARSFRGAKLAAPAIGANILGSVLGGWAEYSTMALGIRALVLLAGLFYGLSLLLLVRSTRSSRP